MSLGILRFLLWRKHNIRTTPIAGEEQVPELATEQVIVSDTPCLGTVEKLVRGYWIAFIPSLCLLSFAQTNRTER